MKNKLTIGVLCLCTVLFLFITYYIAEYETTKDHNYIGILEEKDNLIENQNKKIALQQETIEKQSNTIKGLKEKVDQQKAELNKINKEKKLTKSDEKKVFLTFDDGPTTRTKQILDILEKEKVQATFFTIGTQMERYPEIVTNTFERGHAVLPHSYSHDYSMYTTFDTFYKDFYKANDVYQSILGVKPPPFFRFPGGSSNQTSFRFGGKQFMPSISTDLLTKGYHYIDWNVSSGDASPSKHDPEKMLEQIQKSSQNKNLVVILFHDVDRNEATAKILPKVIDFYKKNAFSFRTFQDITETELKKLEAMGIANRKIIH